MEKFSGQLAATKSDLIAGGTAFLIIAALIAVYISPLGIPGWVKKLWWNISGWFENLPSVKQYALVICVACSLAGALLIGVALNHY